MEQEDLYEILGIASDASLQEVRGACRRILTQVHPDHGGSDALFRVVYRAYHVLTDPDRRAEYDASLRSSERATPLDPDPEPAEDGDGLGAWVPAEPAAPVVERCATTASKERLRPASAVAHHPSLSVLAGAFVLFVVASAAQAHGMASLGLAVGAAAVVGQAGHRRALKAEDARRARIGDVDAMSDQEFERHLAAVFRRDGFAVRARARPVEGGVDLVLKKGASTTVVRTQHGSAPVEPELVHEVVAARERHRADLALVVTNSLFSSEALALAGSGEVTLMGRDELTVLMAAQAAAPRARGLALLRGELQHGVPALLGLVGALLVGVLALLEVLGAAWEAGAAPVEEVTTSPCDPAGTTRDAAAS